MEQLNFISWANLPLSVVILVMVIVNHLKVKDLCGSIRRVHDRIDNHLKNHY